MCDRRCRWQRQLHQIDQSMRHEGCPGDIERFPRVRVRASRALDRDANVGRVRSHRPRELFSQRLVLPRLIPLLIPKTDCLRWRERRQLVEWLRPSTGGLTDLVDALDRIQVGAELTLDWAIQAQRNKCQHIRTSHDFPAFQSPQTRFRSRSVSLPTRRDGFRGRSTGRLCTSGFTTEFFESCASFQSSNFIPRPDLWRVPPVEWIGSKRISESVIAITTQGRRLDVRPGPSSAEKVIFSMMRSPIAMSSLEFSNPGNHISSSSRAGLSFWTIDRPPVFTIRLGTHAVSCHSMATTSSSPTSRS